MERSDSPASEATAPTYKRPRPNQLRAQRKSVRLTAVESTWVPLAPKTIGHVKSLVNSSISSSLCQPHKGPAKDHMQQGLHVVADRISKRLATLRVPKMPRGLSDLTHTEARTMTRLHEEELLTDIDYLYNLELQIENQEKLVAQKVANSETLKQWTRDHGPSPNGDHSLTYGQLENIAYTAGREHMIRAKAVERLQQSDSDLYQADADTTLAHMQTAFFKHLSRYDQYTQDTTAYFRCLNGLRYRIEQLLEQSEVTLPFQEPGAST